MLVPNHHIHYIEWKVPDLEMIKAFYGAAFGWTFTDYGDDYTAINNGGLDGGFERSDTPVVNGALVILYHNDLEKSLEMVKYAGGIINKEIFSFPGGRRYHFLDPAGNELAVWSDQGLE